MMDITSYGSILKRYRKKVGIFQEDLADVAHTSGSHVCNIEKGHRNGNLLLLREFARVFGVDIIRLIPSWLYSRRKLTLYFHPGKRFHQGGIEKQKVIFGAYLLRNWDRLTQRDLAALIATIKGIHNKWPEEAL